jgi:hypothetical protein
VWYLCYTGPIPSPVRLQSSSIGFVMARWPDRRVKRSHKWWIFHWYNGNTMGISWRYIMKIYHPSWQLKTNETEVFNAKIIYNFWGFPSTGGYLWFSKAKKDCEMLRTSNIFGLDKLWYLCSSVASFRIRPSIFFCHFALVARNVWPTPPGLPQPDGRSVPTVGCRLFWTGDLRGGPPACWRADWEILS